MATQTSARPDEGARLTDAARNVAQQAEQTVEAKASTTMDQVSTAIDSVAQAIRRAGDELRQEQPQVASIADTAAGQVDRVSQYLQEHEPREVFDALEDTARRQPALLIAGGIALGLVVGRLLRTAAPTDESFRGPGSSGHRTRGSSSASGMGTSGDYSSGTRTGYGGTSSDYGRASTGNGGGMASDVGDTGSSIIAGTRVVRRGSEAETATPRGSSRR
jgi:hypothetical protein